MDLIFFLLYLLWVQPSWPTPSSFSFSPFPPCSPAHGLPSLSSFPSFPRAAHSLPGPLPPHGQLHRLPPHSLSSAWAPPVGFRLPRARLGLRSESGWPPRRPRRARRSGPHTSARRRPYLRRRLCPRPRIAAAAASRPQNRSAELHRRHCRPAPRAAAVPPFRRSPPSSKPSRSTALW
jgi:hypothetical protein